MDVIYGGRHADDHSIIDRDGEMMSGIVQELGAQIVIYASVENTLGDVIQNGCLSWF